MASDATQSPTYAGEYRHGIDSKNRITIPATWRSGDSATFYLRIDSTGSFIHVMPLAEFRKFKEKIENSSDSSARDRMHAVRQFASQTQECTADKQGRMVLPPEFCVKAGFHEEVVLAGAFDRFEIWNSERWDATRSEEATAYNNLASQLGL